MDIKMKRRFDEKNLPDMKSIFSEVDTYAKDVTIGETLFFKEKGVKSEGEYKRQMAASHKVMKHSHIGWNSWQATAEGFSKIYEELKKAGTTIDRFGVALDWVMGVPVEYRNRFQAGGSLIFQNEDEWKQLGQIVPVQPHLGDHMIGSLNSLENTTLGLKAGVTTIGNISHYYTYEYPGLDMEEYRTIDTMKAIALMGKFREQGTIIHSNLDDGFGAQFHDLANMVGYARLERYIVEDLLGAGMCHCFGNLFSDPILRIVFNCAMGKINRYDTPGSMIYGNTIDYGYNIPRNYGAMASFSMADAIGQMHYPSGHAVCPIPVTEATRVPSAEEIIEAHHTVDMMIEKAKHYGEFIDYAKVEAETDILVTCGNIFFERVLNGLDSMHIDITHAGQVLAALKAIGVDQLEANFGVGMKKEHVMRGRVPVRPTSIVQIINLQQDEVMKKIDGLEKKPLDGVNIVIGATDVHEFGKELCKNILAAAGAKVFDIGSTISIDELADTIIETESQVAVVSTYNGMALSFARDMLKKFREEKIQLPIIMGGRLNETMEGEDLPVDVTDQLKLLGINADNCAETMVSYIIEAIKE
ncbi:MAG: methylmalonyl-CoA mutase [Lachnospiraceae bacterium]|nr:methylmalonyl-CoA mutase [Lachnospiraceae bacterium]